jgi:hypothetical protein
MKSFVITWVCPCLNSENHYVRDSKIIVWEILDNEDVKFVCYRIVADDVDFKEKIYENYICTERVIKINSRKYMLNICENETSFGLIYTMNENGHLSFDFEFLHNYTYHSVAILEHLGWFFSQGDNDDDVDHINIYDFLNQGKHVASLNIGKVDLINMELIGKRKLFIEVEHPNESHNYYLFDLDTFLKVDISETCQNGSGFHGWKNQDYLSFVKDNNLVVYSIKESRFIFTKQFACTSASTYIGWSFFRTTLKGIQEYIVHSDIFDKNRQKESILTEFLEFSLFSRNSLEFISQDRVKSKISRKISPYTCEDCSWWYQDKKGENILCPLSLVLTPHEFRSCPQINSHYHANDDNDIFQQFKQDRMSAISSYFIKDISQLIFEYEFSIFCEEIHVSCATYIL